MVANLQQLNERDGRLSALDVAILTLNLAKKASGITSIKVTFGSASVLMTTIRVCFLFYDDELLAHLQPERCGRQKRMGRYWANLHRCVYGS